MQFCLYSVNRGNCLRAGVRMRLFAGRHRSDSNFHIFAIHSREYYYWPAVKGAWVFPMKYAALSRNVSREGGLISRFRFLVRTGTIDKVEFYIAIEHNR